MTNYTDLKRLAEAANQIKTLWYLNTSRLGNPVDINFIAAASPDVILGLLADLERKDALLRQALDALDDTRYVSKYIHIKDAIEAIRKVLK